MVVNDNNYNLELVYTTLGKSFLLLLLENPKKLIFSLKVRMPFSGKIFFGTEFGKTKLIEIAKIHYGHEGRIAFSFILKRGLTFHLIH